jgi:putative effector of murein hydrolase LrgA (UPF0299 family)
MTGKTIITEIQNMFFYFIPANLGVASDAYPLVIPGVVIGMAILASEGRTVSLMLVGGK